MLRALKQSYHAMIRMFLYNLSFMTRMKEYVKILI